MNPIRDKRELWSGARSSAEAPAFNATNTPLFGDPKVTYGGTTFGVISSERVLQLALKLTF